MNKQELITSIFQNIDAIKLDDINKIRQSDDSYKNLSEEYKLMEKGTNF